jgi:hypothetical protein
MASAAEAMYPGGPKQGMGNVELDYSMLEERIGKENLGVIKQWDDYAKAQKWNPKKWEKWREQNLIMPLINPDPQGKPTVREKWDIADLHSQMTD